MDGEKRNGVSIPYRVHVIKTYITSWRLYWVSIPYRVHVIKLQPGLTHPAVANCFNSL